MRDENIAFVLGVYMFAVTYWFGNIGPLRALVVGSVAYLIIYFGNELVAVTEENSERSD